MILKKISILIDNYIWILCNVYGACIIIDPGLSEPVISEMKKKKLYPIAILLTHNHSDHTDGVKNIIKYYPKVKIFGPYETKEKYVTHIITEGDEISILDRIFYVFFTPGHTLGHVSYYSKPYLFCGDTLFSGGCGRVYKKKYLDMYNSLKLIQSFPDSTFLCCAHEYTLENLKFAMSILPDDKRILFFFKKIKNVIQSGKSSLPSYILFEKKINLFLRTDEIYLKEIMKLKGNSTPFDVFVQLRIKKDSFFGAKRD
ncbi:hydroxyacylglutathione hydrolase [Buchnera aphidicola]|uniref:Hydroxyacylglutathione hydrolase n=1 Tax=Buchnera aphidicola (Artemisaphis artemisicola) TaxID=1241836 RepID=A0A4D6XKK9_9GAMM|nr:hydroxyacylglutathione hydrolase [Buchnera aphidicola]QCI15927.1 hydroxyacylglutathione hydrolase [Buchnera aphidicola (Artemisaphis artemisicola)]